jgi:hypothetical protein
MCCSFIGDLMDARVIVGLLPLIIFMSSVAGFAIGRTSLPEPEPEPYVEETRDSCKNAVEWCNHERPDKDLGSCVHVVESYCKG